ncbi:MAG: acetoacetate decarboxylase family protein [Prochloraceae cyanobacterium]
MNYPTPPWNLQGFAIQTLHLIPIKRAIEFVPQEMEIVAVLPGFTLGGIYLSSYESGSLLEYNELIVTPGLVRYAGKTGARISHIYVDSETSVAGGREIWGLPKEMAAFTWENNNLTVRQKDRLLCKFNYKPGAIGFQSWWRPKFSGSVISGLESQKLFFTSQFEAKIKTIRGNLEIPADSPFSDLNFGKPLLIIKLDRLNLLAGIPENIDNKKD